MRHNQQQFTLSFLLKKRQCFTHWREYIFFCTKLKVFFKQKQNFFCYENLKAHTQRIPLNKRLQDDERLPFHE